MRSTFLILSTVSILPAVAGAAAPAAKKPVAKKPAPATKAGGPVVLGTKQLPGDFGQFGTTYTLGKDEPLNFTLKSAEYSISRVNLGTNSWVPGSGQKVLVLHYTVQNPNPQEARYYWADLKFTAVGKDDKNYEYLQVAGREGTTDSVEINLKPAQKLEVWGAILVPAEGVVPKLIVERQEGCPVVRYDLRGKVKGLAAPFVEASDADAATVAKQVTLKPGEVAPIGVFDAKLESVAYTTEALGGTALEKGQRFLAATFTLKNSTGDARRYYWGDFEAEVRDADGEKAPFVQQLLKASRNETAEGDLPPGEEYRVRFLFVLPEKVDGKTIILKEGKQVDSGNPRSFHFDLTGAK